MDRDTVNEGMAQTRIFFDPWVGETYGTDKSIFKKKILVLGGSHYCEECATCGDRMLHPGCISYTRDRIGEYLNPAFKASRKKTYTWKKTHTSFINSMYGVSTSHEQQRLYFSSICFYNFLQLSAGKDPNSAHRYNYKDIRHRLAFYEVIRRWMPDIVISWGDKVWNALPDDWGYGTAKKGAAMSVAGTAFTSYPWYPFEETTVLLIGVHHPSTGYDRGLHHEVFSRLEAVPKNTQTGNKAGAG